MGTPGADLFGNNTKYHSNRLDNSRGITEFAKGSLLCCPDVSSVGFVEFALLF